MLIGVLGAGQLGRMLALAGYPLGLRFRFLDPGAGSPAGQVAPQIVGDYNDERTLAAFADGLDFATLEFENVPVGAARWLAQHVPMSPPARALEVGQDRLAEKTLFQQVGLEVHRFQPADSPSELADAIEAVGAPVVIKTRRGGYDGKGQALIQTSVASGEVHDIWSGLRGVPLLVEKFVPFDRELSIIAVRSNGGEFVAYPLIQNTHSAGILRHSVAPAPGVGPELQARAERYARAVMDELAYVGVLTIEFFEVRGELLANEMAPRVHNSGHWTIEGAETSQFENHVRAVAGLPLGSTRLRGVSHMLNLIGGSPDLAAMLAVPGAHVHKYGKEPRAGRKIGHVTFVSEDAAHAGAAAGALRDLIAPTQQ